MLVEKIEARWIEAFETVLRQCALTPGESVAILSESQSRAVLIELAELAAQRLGARVFHVRVPTPKVSVTAGQGAIPIRSTGASEAIGGLTPVIDALAAANLVLDCTVEGLLHARELPAILAGARSIVPRVLMISNEHPEILERCVSDPSMETTVRVAMRRLRGARQMRVHSNAGSELTIELANARVGGVWGFCAKPGQVSHWPGGLCIAFPAAKSVNGTLVLAPGDVNLTFKRYLRDRIVLTIENDYITRIDGDGVDAQLMRGYWQAFNEPEAYAVSHVGWGLNPHARWDSMAFYDPSQFNGTELRAFAGNFLYSTGANEVAGRHTRGHFDLPMAHCSVELDGHAVVREGVLVLEEPK